MTEKARMDLPNSLEWLTGGGEVASELRVRDWSSSTLGSIETWPGALRFALGLILDSPQPMFIAWGADLLVLFNDAYRPILGTRALSALGARLADVWPETWDAIRPVAAMALAGQPVRFDDRLFPMTRDGALKKTWWSSSYSPLRHGDGAIGGILCITRESTRDVLSAASLDQSNERLQMALSAGLSIGTWDWDITNDRVVADERFAVMYGVDAVKAAAGAPIAEFLHTVLDIDRECLRGAIAAAVETGDPFEAEYRMAQPDGSVRWVAAQGRCVHAADGTPLRFPGVAFDITDRKTTEDRLKRLNETLESEVAKRTAELQESEARMRAIFETSYTLKGIVALDGTVLDTNTTALSVIGATSADITGKPLWETPWFSSTPGMPETIRAAVDAAANGQSLRRELTLQLPDGLRSFDFSLSPIRDQHGKVVALAPEAIETTERRQAEEALRQSQKMEAVGQLTGGVAHDFNNLLTVIRSSIDLLKRPNLAEDRRQRYIEAISDTTTRAAKLTGQLLAFARRQTLQPEVFDVAASIVAISDMVGTLTGSRIRIDTDVPSAICFVNADPSQFDTAIVNLAVNARDAMNGEGRLSIAVSTSSQIPALRSHPAVRGDYVVVTMTDTGSGIAPEDLDRIFEPFFTTKSVGLGTGLGLSQVFGFVKQSGGEVAVESKVGRGTTFRLYLPRVERADRQAEGSDRRDTMVDGHGTRVLVVEDNADVGSFAAQTLTELGYAPVLAPHAAAALHELQRDAMRFDVVFSDVVMPGMNGIDLGEEIRRLYPDLPVVLTSGYSHVLAQNGTHGFEILNKPYSIEQLSRILQKASYWRRTKRALRDDSR